MKIDKLITKLNKLKEKHGNLEILYQVGDGRQQDIEICFMSPKHVEAFGDSFDAAYSTVKRAKLLKSTGHVSIYT